MLEVGTGFHPDMTGRENIYLNGAILGMRKQEITRKLDEIIAFSGVERYIDTPVKRYSSGMYVRLAFAVAAHLESEILIVDEVLAVGDAEFQKKCLGKMNDVSKGEGRTVLFVSHNMASIQNLCNHGIYMKNGTIDYEGEIQQTIEQYLLGNSIVGSSKNLIKKYKSPYFSQVSSVSLHDIDTDIERTSFKMGNDIKVRIELNIIELFDNLSVNVRMNDVYGNGIAGWRMKEQGIQFNVKEKTKTMVDLIIQKLNVFDGVYNFSISLTNGNEVIDFIDNIINFEIIPAENEMFGKVVSKSYNLIYTPNEWKINLI
ncbi:Teichoic acids export ATP-binding protein TagH [compost metagenome]